MLSNTQEIDRRVKEKLMREMGPIVSRLLQEPDVVEILLNPDHSLWVERLGRSWRHTPFRNAKFFMFTS